MIFDAAWEQFDIGDYVAVSNGMPEIPNGSGVAWRVWRSHNIIGKLVTKIDQTPRRMIIELSKINGATTGYEFVEGLGHDFSPSDANAAVNDASVASAKMSEG